MNKNKNKLKIKVKTRKKELNKNTYKVKNLREFYEKFWDHNTDLLTNSLKFLYESHLRKRINNLNQINKRNKLNAKLRSWDDLTQNLQNKIKGGNHYLITLIASISDKRTFNKQRKRQLPKTRKNNKQYILKTKNNPKKEPHTYNKTTKLQPTNYASQQAYSKICIKNYTKALGSGRKIPYKDSLQINDKITKKKETKIPFKILELAGLKINIECTVLNPKTQIDEDLLKLLDINPKYYWDVDEETFPKPLDHSNTKIIPNPKEHNKLIKSQYFIHNKKFNNALKKLNQTHLEILNFNNTTYFSNIYKESNLAKSTIRGYISDLEKHELIQKYWIKNLNKKKIKLTKTGNLLNILINNKTIKNNTKNITHTQIIQFYQLIIINPNLPYLHYIPPPKKSKNQ